MEALRQAAHGGWGLGWTYSYARKSGWDGAKRHARPNRKGAVQEFPARVEPPGSAGALSATGAPEFYAAKLSVCLESECDQGRASIGITFSEDPLTSTYECHRE